MSDKFKGFLVTLEVDLDDESVDIVTLLLRQIRGIVSVDPIPANGIDDCIIRNRIRSEFAEKFKRVSVNEDKHHIQRRLPRDYEPYAR